MGQQGSQSAYTYIYMCVCTLTLDFHFHNNIHHYCQSSRINRKGHLIPEQSVKKPLIYVQCMYVVAVYGRVCLEHRERPGYTGKLSSPKRTRFLPKHYSNIV